MNDRRLAEAERLGWRNAWLPEALEFDTRQVTRWFRLNAIYHDSAGAVTLFSRVLGWDSSSPPSWVGERSEGRITVECTELVSMPVEALIDAQSMSEFRSGQRESRRLELPVGDWQTDYDAKAWKLNVPLVLYELWPSPERYEQLRALWEKLASNERESLDMPASAASHLGSTVLLIPKMQSFFADAHNIVICGDEFSARAKSICSEALDGPLTLARSYAPIVPEAVSSRSSQDVLKYVGLHYRDSDLQSLSAPPGEIPDAVSRLPPQIHGLSGSDWRLTLVGSDGLADVCTVGLIRGIGDGYFTSEPWRTRAASLGFSAPARIIHVPPTVDGERLAFKELSKAGKAPLRIADPYAGSDQLERFGELLRGSRLLTGAKATARGITPQWLQNRSLDVRILPSLHDRFVTGSRIGVIMGASLNGLGKRDSFLVLINAQMQQQLEQTFEELWAKGKPIDRND